MADGLKANRGMEQSETHLRKYANKWRGQVRNLSYVAPGELILPPTKASMNGRVVNWVNLNGVQGCSIVPFIFFPLRGVFPWRNVKEKLRYVLASARKLGTAGAGRCGFVGLISQTARAHGEIAQPTPLVKGAGLALVVDRRLGREAAWEPGYVPHGSDLTRLSP